MAEQLGLDKDEYKYEIFPSSAGEHKLTRGVAMPYGNTWGMMPPQYALSSTGNAQLIQNTLFIINRIKITADELPVVPKDDGKRGKKKGSKKGKGFRYGTLEWAECALVEACEEIRAAQTGLLNITTTKQCYTIGGIVGGGLLDDEKTWEDLKAAIEGNPLHDQKMLADGERSYKNGKEKPFKFKLHCPLIKIMPNQVGDIVDEIEDALIAGDTNLYQRGGKIIYPCAIKGKSHRGENTQTPGVQEVTVHQLFELADRVAQYEKPSDDGWYLCDAPRNLMNVLKDRGAALRFPVLRAITNTPLVLFDGRTIETPGYDEASGILYDPQGVEFPPIPQNPTKNIAKRALQVINEPFVHYRLKDAEDKLHEEGQPLPPAASMHKTRPERDRVHFGRARNR
jgi:hypothetical protein